MFSFLKRKRNKKKVIIEKRDKDSENVLSSKTNQLEEVELSLYNLEFEVFNENIANTVSATVQGMNTVNKYINLGNEIEQYKEVMMEAVRTKSGQVSLLDNKRLKGFVFEAHHKATFNIDRAAKGLTKEDITARIGGDMKFNGEVLSPYDRKTDIIIETNPRNSKVLGFKQPMVKKEYQAKVYSDKQKTIRQLNKYHDVNHLTTSDYLAEKSSINANYDHKQIESDAITNTELMEKTVQSKDGTVKYTNSKTKKKEFIDDYRKRAVKGGFIIGSFSAAINSIYHIMKSQEAFTEKEFSNHIINILKGGIDGGSRAGYMSIVGLLAGNNIPSLAIGNALYDFSKDLFQFYIGNIDADELLCKTVNHSVVSTASVSGATIGELVGEKVGISFGMTVGSKLGQLGVAIGGVLGGLAFGLGASTLVKSALKEGYERFNLDSRILITS